jgi:N-acetylneuraminic acid mutarotase
MLFFHPAHQAEVVKSKIYVLGGRESGRVLTHEVEMYDPKTDTWSHVSDMPNPRSIFATTVWDDAIYVFGGNGLPIAD